MGIAVGISQPAHTVSHAIYPVPQHLKTSLLLELLRRTDTNSVLVFTRTKHGANKLSKQLEQDGISSTAIHGNKSQGNRTRALADFKHGDVRVLVATDIAARGLDIDRLPHVVNFELPSVSEDYVHRIGRTGRAGNSGIAISFAVEGQANVSFPQDYGSSPLYFGSSGVAGWDRKFSGTLDEVSLYGRALTSGEVAAVFAAGADGKCKAPIITTLQLVDVIKGAIPRAKWEERLHPATRTFQALRIAVNEELTSLEHGLASGLRLLKKGGRVVVISFHSLEDRIVKHTLRTLAQGCTCPKAIPVCVCGKTPAVRILTGKPVTAGEPEVAANPRARSARLRAAEKL